MMWPGPSSINQFNALPDSEKSKLEGDTVQIPNVAAYFSNNFRDFVIPFYFKNYQGVSRLPFPPLVLNHPPEYSWVVINVNTDTTYLEEFVYPLRDSLFVNGFETYRPDGTPVFWGAPELTESTKSWYTKTKLRYYPSNILVRSLVWFGIVVSILAIYRLGRKIAKE